MMFGTFYYEVLCLRNTLALCLEQENELKSFIVIVSTFLKI